ncbi:putative mitochondrial flavine adenine dinucleotide carrier protein [Scheffersomyces amazonensis]|uniref:putative mitochondrial flavine adenine dinucleotide carrier protein n=1 Tax=Scheffersomyces amazonensis TaxID=1078765 RepID=UPI00315D0855
MSQTTASMESSSPRHNRKFLTDPRQIDALAGLSAGFMTTIVGHPLDLIKVRLQLAHTDVNTNNQPFNSIIQVVSRIRRDSVLDYNLYKSKNFINRYYSYHVLKQFYRGIIPNLIGNISAWSLYFTLYAEFKSLLGSQNSTMYYFTASSMAGITTSIITNPIWVLKTRFLSSSSHERESYKSLRHGISTMLRNEGIFSFWKGLIPSLASIFQASIQFTVYDNLKSYINESKSVKTNEQLTTLQYIYCSALSKISSMIVMYPTQVIRSRIQITRNNSHLREIIRDLYINEGGIKGFYKGLSANIVRVLPATCVTFVVYESVKNYLS